MNPTTILELYKKRHSYLLKNKIYYFLNRSLDDDSIQLEYQYVF